MAARANPLDRQTIDLARADPCVRLLNATASIGCATPRDGVTVPLHTLLVAEDLEAAATGGCSPAAWGACARPQRQTAEPALAGSDYPPLPGAQPRRGADAWHVPQRSLFVNRWCVPGAGSTGSERLSPSSGWERRMKDKLPRGKKQLTLPHLTG